MCFGTVLTLFNFAFFSTSVSTAEPFDPAAGAKVIAPFLREQTVGVIHLDITRIEVEPLFDQLEKYPFIPKSELAEVRRQISIRQSTLIQLGVKDLYAVVDCVIGRSPMFIVIPLTEETKEQEIRKFLREPKDVIERWGDALVICDPDVDLDVIRSQKPDPRPDLAAALAAAGDTAVQAVFVPPKYFARVVDETLPELPKEIGGGSSKVFTQGILWVAAGIDLPPHPALRVVIQSKDASSAEALRAKLVDMMNLITKNKDFRQFIHQPEETVSHLTPKVEGDRLTLTLDEQSQGVKTLLTLLTPPLKQARTDAARRESVNHLKQLAVAMHNYYDVHKHFPLPGSLGPDKKPLLSWRVQLLPYLEHNELYKQFHLDEPWDSEHNRKLIDKMPAVFRHPLSKKGTGYTNYVLPVGNGTGFDADTPTKIKDITDGMSNTIMIVEVDDAHAVIWTKPDDLPFDPEAPAKGLGRFFHGGYNACFFDGTVRLISPNIDVGVLRALFTREGGEVVDID